MPATSSLCDGDGAAWTLQNHLRRLRTVQYRTACLWLDLVGHNARPNDAEAARHRGRDGKTCLSLRSCEARVRTAQFLLGLDETID